jgi:YebC/PmpR family DNA-binding regulatory protein
MSGHSKWANIKHKKARTDAKRGKIFSKLVKEIMVAAKIGGSDLSANPRLRTAIESGKAENLPADNIERAIKKGAGELDGITYEEGTYEGYGPCGVAIIVSYMTDNKNRTVGEVRNVFTKAGGNLGESGSVSWIFEKKGLISFDASAVEEERLMDVAIDAGAEDVVNNEEDSLFEIYTDPANFHKVKTAIDATELKYSLAELTMIPSSTVHVEGKDARRIIKFIDDLEDLDDVQEVHANFDMSAEDMEAVA